MAGEFTQFGMRTGHVDLIDYDLAITRQCGALLDEEQNEWYLPINFHVEDPTRGPVALERALVVFKRPEPTQVQHEVPQIAIIRDDIDPDTTRLFSPTVQYRLPAAGATPVCIPCGPFGESTVGFDCYETKDKEQPYNLTYTIEVWSRYRVPAQTLLQMMMKVFPLRGTMTVTATEEAGRNVRCDRTYLFFQEGVADLTEVNSMVERIPGFALTIRVEAELTLDREPFTVSAFTGGTSEQPIPGTSNFPDGCPDLPPGGLYGDGLASVRATLLED
jgi:hypothetical protein